MKYLITFILISTLIFIITFILTSCKVSSLISNEENSKNNN